MLYPGIHLDRDRTPVTVAQRRLERLGDALLQVLAHAQPVDDDFDGVLLILGQARRGIDFVDCTVDAHPHEALGAQFHEQLGLLAFAVDDHRRQNHQLGFFRHHQHRVDHL